MSNFDALKSGTAKDLTGKLNQLAQENFKAKFTTEAMTSQRGAEIRKRRREIARIKTVLAGRETLAKAQAEEKALAQKLKAIGAPHEGGANQKNARRKVQQRLEQVKRTVRELDKQKAK